MPKAGIWRRGINLREKGGILGAEGNVPFIDVMVVPPHFSFTETYQTICLQLVHFFIL